MEIQMLAGAYAAIGLVSVMCMLCFGYFMVYLYTVLLVHKVRHLPSQERKLAAIANRVELANQLIERGIYERAQHELTCCVEQLRKL